MEHRWLGYEPAFGTGFIAVCSCGWRSPAQHTAGVAGALLDAHRNEARKSRTRGENATSMYSSSEDGTGVDGDA